MRTVIAAWLPVSPWVLGYGFQFGMAWTEAVLLGGMILLMTRALWLIHGQLLRPDTPRPPA